MKYIKSIYIGLVGMLMTACQTEQWESPQGGLCITLAEDVSVSTKSTPAELGEPTAEVFTLNIIKESTGESLYNNLYTSQPIPASAGTYTVTATCGTDFAIALDSPYYKGEATGVEVGVGTEQPTQVTLTCKVANALASVIYGEGQTDKFNELFSTYGVEVKVGNSSATIGRNGSTTQSVYYRAGSTPTFTFKGTLKENNQNVSMEITSDQLTADAFQAGQHCIFTLSLEPTTAGAIITVKKVEVETVTISETIPMEWLPKPKIDAEGFEANKLTFTETETPEASIKLNTSSTLQDLKIKFNFEDSQFTAFNQEYTLSTLDEETRKNIEETLGIFLPQVGDAASTIQLNNLIAQLQTKNAGETTNNTIELDVKANNRWSSEDATTNRVYTLTCNKPEFSVSVDAGNCWSREFTINEITVTTGNAEIIKNNLKYQYYNGTEWIECTTRDAIKGRTQQFNIAAEDITQKNYKVRALYRDIIASTETEVSLEMPEQLPNSGMEEWYIEEKKKSSTWPFPDKTYYTFHPYLEGAANYSWWDTNNDKAQGGTVVGTIWYEGCFASCVSYTNDAHEGSKAALIYVSGCGDGYANTSGTYVGGAMVGSLFIGTYNSGISQGHNFSSRPSSLSFWYKYKPYNTDTFKAIISLKNGDKEIATGTYEPTAYSTEDNEYNQANIILHYNNNNEKATTICVQFLASNKTSLSENDFEKGTTINYPVIGNWTVHMGSVLKIDDISLTYDK